MVVDVRFGFRIARGLTAGLVATTAGVLLLAGGDARAAVVHHLERATTEAISSEALTCHGPGSVLGPLGQVNALTIAPGQAPGEAGSLWVAEQQREEESHHVVERVDTFNDTTGGCVGQLENVSSLQKAFFGGITVGVHTGEREVYVGTIRQQGVGEALVAVFGPSGKLQGVWTGADTPDGSFQKSVGGGERM